MEEGGLARKLLFTFHENDILVGLQMGNSHIQNLHKGECGEHRVAILLHHLGFCVAQPRPDRFGTDTVGYRWLEQPTANSPGSGM